MTDFEVMLPWAARPVRRGDVLSTAEARELVIVQGGVEPLFLVPLADDGHVYRVEAPSPRAVLESLLLSAPALVISEAEALSRRRDEAGYVAFVPIGGEQVVPVPYPEASPDHVMRAGAWEEAMCRTN